LRYYFVTIRLQLSFSRVTVNLRRLSIVPMNQRIPPVFNVRKSWASCETVIKFGQSEIEMG